MPPWAAASMKSLSAMGDVVSVFAHETTKTSPTSAKAMPSLAATERAMSLGNGAWFCFTGCFDSVGVFVSDCLVNVGCSFKLAAGFQLRLRLVALLRTQPLARAQSSTEKPTLMVTCQCCTLPLSILPRVSTTWNQPRFLMVLCARLMALSTASSMEVVEVPVSCLLYTSPSPRD